MIITKRNFTKSERVFARFLIENKIPFKTKVKIKNREIDFLIGKYVIEIDCHEQDGTKNEMLVREGFIPIHFSNREIKQNEFNKFSRWSFEFRNSSNGR